MIRLFAQDGAALGTAEIRIPQVRRRTIRHRGVLYELIAERDGVRDYRATEPIPQERPRLAVVMNADGSPIGEAAIPAHDTPAAVTHEGVLCPLWTVRDQQGRVVYLKPNPEPEAA